MKIAAPTIAIIAPAYTTTITPIAPTTTAKITSNTSRNARILN